jgi:hypothetical protein
LGAYVSPRGGIRISCSGCPLGEGVASPLFGTPSPISKADTKAGMNLLMQKQKQEDCNAIRPWNAESKQSWVSECLVKPWVGVPVIQSQVAKNLLRGSVTQIFSVVPTRGWRKVHGTNALELLCKERWRCLRGIESVSNTATSKALQLRLYCKATFRNIASRSCRPGGGG